MPFGLPALIALLVVSSTLAIVAKRIRVPYSAALVVGGMVVTVSGAIPEIAPLNPDLVFYLFLPALLFDGGLAADLDSIRRNVVPIAMLAVVGTLLAIGVTGLVLTLVLPVPVIASLLLASLLGGTDTVAILFTFRRVSVPRRLRDIMEGETLFNDGATLVAYSTVVGLVAATSMPSVGALAGAYVITMLGGALIGLVVGVIGSTFVRQAEDPFAEIAATVAIALGANAAGVALGVSGAIAAVASGLVVGRTTRAHLSAQSIVAIRTFWDYIAFGANTFLFLSIGLSTSLSSILTHLPEIAITLGAMFVGRAVAVYGPFLLMRVARRPGIPALRWQHIFVFGNVKGALAVALALALPAMPDRDLLVDIAFGVSFVSLIGQGVTLPIVIRALRVARVDAGRRELAVYQARLVAARAARNELDTLRDAGAISKAGYDAVAGEYQVEAAKAERKLRLVHEQRLAEAARVVVGVRRRLVDAERAAVESARRSGLVSEQAATEVLAELGDKLVELDRLVEEDDTPRGERRGGHA